VRSLPVSAFNRISFAASAMERRIGVFRAIPAWGLKTPGGLLEGANVFLALRSAIHGQGSRSLDVGN